MIVARLVLLVLTVATACAQPERQGHDHAGEEEDPRPAHAVTHYTAGTELFVEFRALARGVTSRFAVHLTRLSDFTPVGEGTVVVLLSGGGGPEERFEVAAPRVPGIFGVDVRPATAGERQLAIVLGAAQPDRHDLGPVTVHATEEQARRSPAPPEAPPGSEISYLKEQQWRTEFATAPVTERPLRAAVAANGILRARAEGEARIAAPVAGRLVTAADSFPRIGLDVERDHVLAAIAPRLGGETDVASLQLAVSRAGIDLERARSERARLEGLFAQGAVAERRLVEARHQEATAEAEQSAARSRLGQYHGTQRTAGGGAAGRVVLRSPIRGTVVRVDVAPGEFVEEGTALLTVVDLDRLWLEVQVPESDVGRARHATGAWFEVEGYERPFEVSTDTGGQLVAFGGVIDPETRTAPLLFELANPGRELRVGMFARVRVLTGESVTAPVVPVSAVVDDGGQDVVYVQVGGESFERRRVSLGARDGELVQVREGVRPGERVVTRGAYTIRLAAASGSIPAHGHVH